MRPRKVTVVRYMIIYIYIYIYTDSAGVDRTRRGSLRLAPKTIFSSLSSVARCVVCRSPSALLRSLAISFPRIAQYLLRVTRYLLRVSRYLLPSVRSLSPSFGSLAISFLQVARYLLRSGRSLIVVSFVWFAVLFRSTSPFFTVSFLPCFGILCVSLAIFSHLQNAR